LAEFDTFASTYQGLVTENVRVTGEPSEYFAAYKAAYVASRIAPSKRSKVLDYGCGIGMLSKYLKEALPEARIDGFDVSPKSLERIDGNLLKQGTFTDTLDQLDQSYDMVVLSNVLHHVKPTDRERLISDSASRLVIGGKLVIFEHNPINPLTRWAVAQCPFDEDAILLPSRETRGYFGGKMRLMWRDYIVFFPRWLKWFRALEPALRWCPMGAQYAVVVERWS